MNIEKVIEIKINDINNGLSINIDKKSVYDMMVKGKGNELKKIVTPDIYNMTAEVRRNWHIEVIYNIKAAQQ